MRLDPRGLLASPAAYHAFALLLGAKRSRAEVVRTYVRPVPGQRVLDCGCGPGEFLEFLPGVDYVGVDVDERYVAAARRRFPERATFRLGIVGPETVPEERHYDLVIAMGLLHHLDDDEVRALLALARRALKPEGKLVTLDPSHARGQSRLARRLIDLDRGRHVREAEELSALVSSVFSGASAHVRHDLLRVPYTHLIMECPASGA